MYKSRLRIPIKILQQRQHRKQQYHQGLVGTGSNIHTGSSPFHNHNNGCPSCTAAYFSSVATSEVTKFSNFSKTWWNPRENPLIGMNTIRMKYIQQQMTRDTNKATTNSVHQTTTSTASASYSLPSDNCKALDIGCGGGLLSESLARLGAHVTAIDPSEALVKEAQRHSQLDPRTRQCIDYHGGISVEDYAANNNNNNIQLFDMICLLEVIEHVTDPKSVLTAIASLLEPNHGKLFVSTLNRTVKSQLVAIVGAEYVMRYLPVGTHDWNQFRSPEEVQSLMDEAGFEQVHVSGMVVTTPPIMGRWDWKLDPKDTDINWIATYQLKKE